MKTILYVSTAVISAMLLSCTPQGERTRMVEKKLPVELFVDSFLAHNPNGLINDIMFEETNKKFAEEIEKALNEPNFLEGIPLHLEGMNQVGKSIKAHFGAWPVPRTWEYKKPTKEVYFDAIVDIPDSLVSTLDKEKMYILYGKNIGIVSYNAAVALYGKKIRVWNPKVSISKNDIWDDQVDLDFGVLIYHLDSIKPFTGKREKEAIKY